MSKMTREEFEEKFAVLCLGGDFKKHKELKALVHAFIEQLEKQIPRWRSVEGGLPETTGPFLWRTTGEDTPVMARLVDGDTLVDGPYRWSVSDVTHYLPLSDLPEPIEEA